MVTKTGKYILFDSATSLSDIQSDNSSPCSVTSHITFAVPRGFSAPIVLRCCECLTFHFFSRCTLSSFYTLSIFPSLFTLEGRCSQILKIDEIDFIYRACLPRIPQAFLPVKRLSLQYPPEFLDCKKSSPQVSEWRSTVKKRRFLRLFLSLACHVCKPFPSV